MGAGCRSTTKIAADKAARLAAAKAFGAALAKAKMTLWGNPTTLQRMSAAFYQGQSTGIFLDGLERSMPDGVKAAAATGVSAMGATLAAVVKKVTGVDIDPGKAESALRETVGDGKKT